MDERVKKFLDAKKAEKEKWNDKEKYKILTEAGLYDKICVEDDPNDDEIFTEFDPENQCQSYYKMVPIDVTDEEYEEIKKYLKIKVETENNPIASALTVIAWILFIGGFVAGIALGMVEVEGYYYSHTEFSFAVAFIYWCIALISGTMFLGFAEIIKLLDAIKNK